MTVSNLKITGSLEDTAPESGSGSNVLPFSLPFDTSVPDGLVEASAPLRLGLLILSIDSPLLPLSTKSWSAFPG